MISNRIFLVIFFGISTVYGQNITQSDSFIVQHYTDEDGLPQNSIKNIARDTYGFVWMTTEDGLVRYDGRHFFTFGRGNALRSSRFWLLVEDWANHLLYASNQSGEILQIDNGRAIRDSSLLVERIRLLRAIPWLHLPDPRFGPTGIPDELNGAYFIGADSFIIVRPHEQLFVYTSGTISEYVAGKKVNSFYQHVNSENRFFCVDELLYYLQEDGRVLNISASSNNLLEVTGDISSAQLRRIPRDQQQLFWNNTSHGSAILFAADHFYHLTRDTVSGFRASLVGKGLNVRDNKVICALYDTTSRKLLVGSSVKGLYVFSRPPFSVLSLPPPGDNVYYAHTLWGNDKVLTAQGVIANINGDKAGIDLPPQPTLTDKYSIITDSDGFVWTKKEQVLFRLDPKNLHILQQWTLDAFIHVLYEGEDHRLYIGTADRQLQTIDLQDSLLPIRKFGSLPSVPKCFLETAPGKLWVGMDSGLCMIDTRKGTVTKAEAAGNLSIRSLYGYDDEVWFTTYERGFFLYRNKQLVGFPVDEHRYLLTAHCIVEDKKGFFWITTNKGLFKTSRADLIAYADGNDTGLHYQHYTKEDGFLTNEFNGGCQPCGLLLPNGWISFPSVNGLVYFDPGSVDAGLPAGNLFIDGIFLNDKEVADTGIIAVPRNTGRITIWVSSPNWTSDNSDYISYAFLSDADTTWVPVGNDNRISLSTLPWGNYTLLIRRINGFEKDRYVYRSLRFVVAAPWYMTPVFLLLASISTVILILAITRWRTRWVRSKNRLLEQKIDNKTHELREALDALQISANELSLRTRIQEKMIASISHDVKVPMGFLKVVSENLFLGLQDSRAESIQQSRLIKDHVTRLYFFMQNLLDYSKAQMGSNFSLNEVILPAVIVEEKKELFADIAAQTDTQVVVDIQQSLAVRSNKILLGIIIHNLIDNAIKVSEAGIVRIEVFKESAYVVIAIQDSGAGFKPAILEWLNNSSTQPVWERPGATSQSSGIGLYIVKDLAALLQIELSAVNVASGALITLRSKAG